MEVQVELSMKVPGPKVSEMEIHKLCSYLGGRGWVKAPQIEAELGKRFSERRIRKISEASDGRIMSAPGSPGYKLLTRATEIAEVDMIASCCESQGKKMLMRGAQIRRRYHRYARP